MPRSNDRTPATALKGRSVANHVARRQQRRGEPGADPSKLKSLHDVYDFAVHQETIRRDCTLIKAEEDRTLRAKTVRDDGHSSREKIRAGRGQADSLDEGDEDPNVRPSYMNEFDKSDGGTKVLAREDSSEIDSDEVFDDSDAEKYEGYVFASDRRKDREDRFDEELDEGEEDDMIDLSNMLGRGCSASGESDLDESDANEKDEPSKDEAASSSRLGGLIHAYSQPTIKRAAGDDEGNGKEATFPKRRRQLIPERTEIMPESEFAAPQGSFKTASVALDDLLAPLSGSAPGELSALRDSIRALLAVEKSRNKGGATQQPIASKRGGGALAAPLPDVFKDRLQRSAGYEQSKEEAEKWQSTIKRLREAEHLSFPLQGAPARPKASTAQLSATFMPINALEADIDKLLETEGLSEKQIVQSEKLAMRRLDPEEAKRRRDKLRKVRELMFRAEQKAKRVSKIKSKTFRKIARKNNEKQEEKLRAASVFRDDKMIADEEGDDERVTMERKRAKERAILKHKNSGKWAQNILGKKDLMADADVRQAIDEQLNRSEQLRRRIESRVDGFSDGENSDGFSDDSDDDPLQVAFDKLRRLDDDASRSNSVDAGGKSSRKGVWDMKFMQDARSRNDAAAEQMRKEFEADLKRMNKKGLQGSDDDAEAGEMAEQPVIGRRIFKASAQAKFNSACEERRPEEAGPDTKELDDDSDSEFVAGNAHIASVPITAPVRPQSGLRIVALPVEDKGEDANPWLSGDNRSQKGKALATSSSSPTKFVSKLEKRKSKAHNKIELAEDDAHVVIDSGAVLNVREKTTVRPTIEDESGSTPASTSQRIAEKATRPPPAEINDYSDDDSDDEDEEPVEMRVPGWRANKQAFTQRDLIAEAFAGEDVTADFVSEKARIASEDAPKEIDDTLPGWGSWVGKGVKMNRKSGAARRKEAELKRQHTAKVSGLDESKRKDARMSNVIINERKDKKAQKYLVKQLPYPYTSANQYNAIRERPIGPEWNTLTQKQRLTMPRVLATKPGAIIKPIQRL